MSMSARLRRFWWRRVRRYDGEMCGRPRHPYQAIREGCGRPVGVVWHAPAGVWNYIVAGQDQTVYTVWKGNADGPLQERAHGVGGVLCLRCFDRMAREAGCHVRWEATAL